MKRLLSFFLGWLFFFSCVSCAKSGNAAEEALLALKRFDLEMFSACMTSDAEGELAKIRKNASSLTDTEREILTELYAVLHYTIGETTEANGQKTVTVKASCPDFAHIRTLAEKKMLVTAETAEEVVLSMLKSGEIEQGYLADHTWQLVLKEEADEWKLAYADKANAAFVKTLYLAEMIAFFVQK